MGGRRFNSFRIPIAQPSLDGHASLRRIKGTDWFDSCHGTLDVGKRTAGLRLDPGGHVRVDLPLDDSIDPSEALRRCVRLPGNARPAKNAIGLSLVADTRIDGACHLPETFERIRRGLKLGCSAEAKPAGPARPLDHELVAKAVGELSLDPDAIVCHLDRWELRPRVRGEVVAVEGVIDGDELRLRRTVLRLPAADACSAILDQTLRYNAGLRHARLGIAERQLVAETRLHRDQLTGRWLEWSARAVAAAFIHARDVLEALACNPEAALQYEIVFGTSMDRNDWLDAGPGTKEAVSLETAGGYQKT